MFQERRLGTAPDKYTSIIKGVTASRLKVSHSKEDGHGDTAESLLRTRSPRVFSDDCTVVIRKSLFEITHSQRPYRCMVPI